MAGVVASHWITTKLMLMPLAHYPSETRARSRTEPFGKCIGLLIFIVFQLIAFHGAKFR